MTLSRPRRWVVKASAFMLVAGFVWLLAENIDKGRDLDKRSGELAVAAKTIDALRAQAEALGAQVAELQDQQRQNAARIEVLIGEVRRLGGNPDTLLVLPAAPQPAAATSSSTTSASAASPTTTSTTSARPATTTTSSSTTTTTSPPGACVTSSALDACLRRP